MRSIADACKRALRQWYRIILDGEMMVFDPISKRFSPFGYLKQAAIGASCLGLYENSSDRCRTDRSNDPDKPRACCALIFCFCAGT